MCPRAGTAVKDRQAYQVMRDHRLLQKRRPRQPELYQSAKLFDLLLGGPNDLWQMDVTYIHIPGNGWRYAVTVIDYFSRYLLACHLTHSYSAVEAAHALKLAREEAERVHGPPSKLPFLVTDNGSSFIARRFVDVVSEQYSHVRIRYRTPTQLGLLERFHQTLKTEEAYWRLYDHPQHARPCLAEFRHRYNELRPHWALRPEQGGVPLAPKEVYADGRLVIPAPSMSRRPCGASGYFPRAERRPRLIRGAGINSDTKGSFAMRRAIILFLLSKTPSPPAFVPRSEHTRTSGSSSGAGAAWRSVSQVPMACPCALVESLKW